MANNISGGIVAFGVGIKVGVGRGLDCTGDGVGAGGESR